MNTKDIILIVAGVAGGYLLAGYLKKSKDGSVTGTTTGTTGGHLPEIDQAKVDKCNKEADDYMAIIRLSAGADLVAIRKQKFDACIAGKS